jgi:hypothetical protein
MKTELQLSIQLTLITITIQFNSKTQIKHNITNTQKQNTKQTRIPVMQGKSNIKVLGQTLYTLKPGKKSLIKTGLQLNVQLSLLMALATEVHLTEGQLRWLKSTPNNLKSLKFRFGTRRPTVSERVGQNFEPLIT